jgi:hypothetical protein
VKTTFLASFLMLAAGGAAAGPVAAIVATPPGTAASAPLRATRAASEACAPQAASRPMRGHVVTSRVRRIPGESDPCAGAPGSAPASSR